MLQARPQAGHFGRLSARSLKEDHQKVKFGPGQLDFRAKELANPPGTCVSDKLCEVEDLVGVSVLSVSGSSQDCPDPRYKFSRIERLAG